MNYKLIIFAVALGINNIAHAQPGAQWTRSYGRDGNEHLFDVYTLADGGYITVGSQTAAGAGQNTEDCYIVKTDEAGRIVWERAFDNDGSPVIGMSVIETDDSDYIIAGNSNYRACALRVSSNGDLRWIRTYGSQQLFAVIELKEGNYILAGQSLPDQSFAALLVKISGDGEQIWRREYRDLANDAGFWGLRETDDGIIAAGYTARNAPFRAWFKYMMAAKVRIDNGEQIWIHRYEDQMPQEWAQTICSCPDGFILAGGGSQRNANSELVSRKIAADGNQVWSQYFDINDGNVRCWVGNCRLPNNDVALVGYAGTDDDRRPIAQVISPEGNVRWSTVYNMNEQGDFDSGFNRFYSVVGSPDRGITACGMVLSEGGENGYDGLIMKLEPLRLDPMIIQIIPEDTILDVLEGDSIRFAVLAQDQRRLELFYLWTYNNADTISIDTSVVVTFDSLGEQLVTCRVANNELAGEVNWHVRVRDLYIESYTPDSLGLTVRRRTTLNFGVIVRATPGDPVQYLWTLTRLDGAGPEQVSQDSLAEIEFDRTGDYRLEALAYRGESLAVVAWSISVRSVLWSFQPEERRLSVALDSALAFSLYASNPQSDSLSYRWYLNGDECADTSEEISIRFDRPTQGDALPQVVLGILRDGSEADTISWSVTVVPPDCVPSGSLDHAPGEFGLVRIYPSPFNSTTAIEFALPENSKVQLTVYDLSGREVTALVNRELKAGAHSTNWNAEGFTSGIYLVKIETPTFSAIKKVTLIR